MDVVWSKVSIPLLFIVQSKFDFEFVYDHDNGFHMLMIHLIELDLKYEGSMQDKIIQIKDLVLRVASNIGGEVVGQLCISLQAIFHLIVTYR